MCSVLFKGLFTYFNNRNLEYVIMNGHENYPDIIDSDIDICINSLETFEVLLYEASDDLNFKIVQKWNHHTDAINYFISQYESENISTISLDIYSSYSFDGHEFFSADWFLRNRLKRKCFYVSEAQKELVYYLVKKIIKKDVVQSLPLFNSNIAVLADSSTLKSFFPCHREDILHALKMVDSNYFIDNARLLKSSLTRSKKVRFSYYIKELARVVSRIFRPTGLTLSILGPDGCGKTTVINALKLRELPFRRCDYFHLKPRFLGPKGDGKPVPNPHLKPQYGKVLSILKLLFFYFDYLIGHLVKILPLKIRSSLIIFDRYYDDILVDPKRFRYGGPLWLSNFVGRFVPKTNITIVLVAEPEIIYSRKKELEFEELSRQLIQFSKINKLYYKVDVNRKPDAIVDEIEKIILGKLNERF